MPLFSDELRELYVTLKNRKSALTKALHEESASFKLTRKYFETAKNEQRELFYEYKVSRFQEGMAMIKFDLRESRRI